MENISLQWLKLEVNVTDSLQPFNYFSFQEGIKILIKLPSTALCQDDRLWEEFASA